MNKGGWDASPFFYCKRTNGKFTNDIRLDGPGVPRLSAPKIPLMTQSLISITNRIVILMKQKLAFFLLLASSLAIFSSGCYEGSIDSPINNVTFLKVRLTDAPLAIDEVNIDLQSILIKGPGGSEEIDLNTNAGIYNLLDYQNGIDTIVANAMISLDEIRQVRLVLGDDNTIVVDGEEYDLMIPSGSQSGLKINLCLDLSGTPQYDLILDFDAAESVHQLGNGRYMMRPVIRVVNPDATCGGDDGDDDLNIDDLPPNTLQYLEDNYDGYNLATEYSELCGGTDVILVEAEDPNTGVVTNVYFGLNGDFLQANEPIDPMDLDPDVTATISADYSDYDEIEEAYLANRFDGEVRYEVGLRNSQNDDSVYLVFDEDGMVLCEE